MLTGVAAGQMTGNRGQLAPTTSIPAGNPAMEAAFEKARATLGDFLTKLADPPAHTGNYAVKIRLVQPDRRHEYIWVTGLTLRGDRVSGRIGNVPLGVTTVRMGQVVELDRSEIYDWMYLDEAKQRMFGNFTLCVLLRYKEPTEAAKMKQAYGLECESEAPLNRK
jgi:uncharacterized protein YegJ (DUF2314 family)